MSKVTHTQGSRCRGRKGQMPKAEMWRSSVLAKRNKMCFVVAEMRSAFVKDTAIGIFPALYALRLSVFRMALFILYSNLRGIYNEKIRF